jgi:N-acetyl-gamma-glutamylphosphate reductase
MTYKIAILGASGYTGAELVRPIAHPSIEIAALSGNRKPQSMAQVFAFAPSGPADLKPRLKTWTLLIPCCLPLTNQPRRDR